MAAIPTAKANHALLGALVADAATVGFHWLYDQNRIRAVSSASGTVAFHNPDERDFQGTMGYFVGHGKKRGDFSHYGETLRLTLSALSAAGWEYDRATLIDAFSKSFGYGGTWVGYIDTPTRETLDNIASFKKDAVLRANALPRPPSFTADDQHLMLVKAKGALAKYSNKVDARAYMETAIAATHPNPEAITHGLAVFDLLVAGNDALPGSFDEQVPALSKVPALVAAYAGRPDLASVVEDAVRVTNNHDGAVKYAHTFARQLEALILSTPPADEAPPFEGNLSEAAEKFGKACPLVNSFPVIQTAIRAAYPSFREAVEANILAGGDNCGRSISIGAFYGALYGIGGSGGIPLEWISFVAERHPLIVGLLSGQSENQQEKDAPEPAPK